MAPRHRLTDIDGPAVFQDMEVPMVNDNPDEKPEEPETPSDGTPPTNGGDDEGKDDEPKDPA